MLEDSLFESAGRTRTHTPMTVISSVLAHAVVIGVLVLMPLLQMQAVPIPRIDMSLWVPKFEHQTEIELVAPKNPVRSQVEVDPDAVIAPKSIPSEIAYVIDPPSIASVSPAGADRGDAIRSLLREITNGEAEQASRQLLLPAQPVPPPAPVAPEPIRRGGSLQQADLIHQVLPSYPPLARQARIQGVVVLEAVINKEGAIETLRVVSGHPLLNQAAIDAVKQWMYRPTLLNGEPVPVITTITVSFSLQ